MTDRLPHNLLALFQPRPPLRYLPPNDTSPEERRTRHIDGVAAFMPALIEKQQAENAKNGPWTESHLERADREKREKQEKQKKLMTVGYQTLYKPNQDPNIRGDAFKTLFLSRLPYDVSTKDIEREFGRFGPIERIRVVVNKNTGKPRGYAFVLFEREKDMKTAYKECEHLSIRGRRVIVDVERGRTVTGWRPRRFGGGLGGRHYTKVPPKPSFGPPSGPGFRGGNFRGGFNDRGGFRGGRGGFRGGGGRGGVGYRGAPSGPRGDRYDDRPNANYEPLPSRKRGYEGPFSAPYYTPREGPDDGPRFNSRDDPRQRRRY